MGSPAHVESAAMGSPILSRQNDFEIPAGEAYLDGAYMSPLPRSARAAVEEAYELKARPYLTSYEKFFEFPDAVRERLSRVLGVPESEVGITNSTGQGGMLIAQGLRWEPGDRVLLGPDEFPANVYPWLALREKGVRVEFIGERASPLQAGQLEEALTGAGRVRLVAVAAVHYTTGNLHPLSEFADLIHRHEALLVTDATQATGSIGIDWPATGVDALLASGYKWLLGPYGTGVAWVRHALLEQIVDVNGNWWANARARDLKALLEYAELPVHGRRMDSGETASFLNLGAWRAGLDYLIDIGSHAVESSNRSLQDRLISQLDHRQIRVVTELHDAHRSPMLFLESTGGLDGEKLQSVLTDAHIRVSIRGGRIRVSPGVWNRGEDMDALARLLLEISHGS
jgi:cysteine desulfurase/selenocysteine lyase